MIVKVPSPELASIILLPAVLPSAETGQNYDLRNDPARNEAFMDGNV